MNNMRFDTGFIRSLSIIKLIYFFLSCLLIITGILENYYTAWNDQRLLLTSLIMTLFITFLTALYAVMAFKKKLFTPSPKGIKYLYIETSVLMLLTLALIWFNGQHMSYFSTAIILLILPVTILLGANIAYVLVLLNTCFLLFLDIAFSHSPLSDRFIEKDLLLTVILFVTIWTINRFIKKDKKRIEALEEKANIDGLTGLYNHRYFHHSLSSEIRSCIFLKQPLTLIFLDLDAFKEFNDFFGHVNGDRILARIADIMKADPPKGAILCRYGGDEFAVILPNITKETAQQYGEKVRKNVENIDLHDFLKDFGTDYESKIAQTKLTVSVGIAQWDVHTTNAMHFIKNADDALYRAKLFRKNRVEIYDSILDKMDIEMDHEDYDLIRSLQSLINIINARDRYTSGHVERVVMYSKALGRELNLEDELRKELSLAAYMHDIGKVNLSEYVLNKPSSLDDEEWYDMKNHSVVGAHILREVAVLSNIAPLVLHHHERYDGSGYPQGLKGEQIPFLARVLTVVDSFDAMTFDRPYKPAMSFQEAIDELRANKGTQFDPSIVEAFIQVVIKSINNKKKETS